MSATTSPPSYDDVIASTCEVWSMMLGVDLDVLSNAPLIEGESITAVVTVTGGWNGAVLVKAGVETALQTGAIMFASDPGETSDEDVRDAMGEIANMIGGSLKDRVGPGHVISIPAVTEGLAYKVYVGHAKKVHEVGFASPDGVVILSVFDVGKPT